MNGSGEGRRDASAIASVGEARRREPAVVCQQPSVVRRPQFRAAGGHGHAESATIATSGGAIVSTGRRLTRGPSPKALVSPATGRDHSSRHRHQSPTAASRLLQQSDVVASDDRFSGERGVRFAGG